MVGIQVTYQGLYHGSRSSNRDQIQWPPSPDRLNQAIVASHYTRQAGSFEEDPAGREALLAFEKMPLPDIIFSGGSESTLMTYVPNNDGDTLGDDRNQRAMVTFNPIHPSVYYIWNDQDIDQHWGAIGKILSYFSYLGSAKSFARAKLILEMPQLPDGYTTITPDENGSISTSIYYDGRLGDLDIQHKTGRMARRIMARYSKVEPPSKTHPGLFKSFFTYKIEGNRLLSVLSAEIANSFRSSLMQLASLDGVKLSCLLAKDNRSNHLAYVPLIYAGSDWSDGLISGCGVGVPHDITVDEEMILGRLLNRLTSISLRGESRSVAQTTAKADRSFTLTPSRWSRPSRSWATVTPMEFRWPKGRLNDLSLSRDQLIDLGNQVRQFCEWSSLPTPTQIDFDPQPWFRGSTLAQKFISSNHLKGRQSGYMSHVKLMFDSPVRGPLVLGRGANFGIGVFSPIEIERQAV